MIKFNKLKVKGFKSFVEPTEIIIETGLTGIVGPNGCGKSNLVEAFRFVMGELSPKQMRGNELDDVIFNGTSGRPAWDIAEVTIELDNSQRKAPSLFNQSEEICCSDTNFQTITVTDDGNITIENYFGHYYKMV